MEMHVQGIFQRFLAAYIYFESYAENFIIISSVFAFEAVSYLLLYHNESKTIWQVGNIVINVRGVHGMLFLL